MTRLSSYPSATQSILLIVLFIVQAPETVAQDTPAATTVLPGEYRVDRDQSWMRVLVYRGGLLRGLGHNHVISSQDLSGRVTIARDPLQSTASLEFRVGELVIDDPALRTLEGADFAARVSSRNIAGTRANLLGHKLLQADRYPLVRVVAEQMTGSLPDLEVVATVVIREVGFPVVFPVRVGFSDMSFSAQGEVEITHRDIGLVPFKAALGTLRVRDKLVIRYQIIGGRIEQP